MNSTIPLLGGVPFSGGEGAFIFLMVILKKDKKLIKDEILTPSKSEGSG
jgi:hypothetical protein